MHLLDFCLRIKDTQHMYRAVLPSRGAMGGQPCLGTTLPEPGPTPSPLCWPVGAQRVPTANPRRRLWTVRGAKQEFYFLVRESESVRFPPCSGGNRSHAPLYRSLYEPSRTDSTTPAAAMLWAPGLLLRVLRRALGALWWWWCCCSLAPFCAWLRPTRAAQKKKAALHPARLVPISVNYHFTRRCNYTCGFCFHTATTSFVLPLLEAQRGLCMLQQAGEWAAMQQFNRDSLTQGSINPWMDGNLGFFGAPLALKYCTPLQLTA